MQNFLGDKHFAGAVAAGFRSKGDAEGVEMLGFVILGTPRAAVEATMPFEPMPASVRPKCRACSLRVASRR